MLAATERAADALTQTLESNDVPEGQGLRLTVNSTGEFGLAVDERHEGDQIVSAGERDLLFVDPAVSDALDGAALDVTQAPDGARLALRIPGGGADTNGDEAAPAG